VTPINEQKQVLTLDLRSSAGALTREQATWLDIPGSALGIEVYCWRHGTWSDIDPPLAQTGEES
jgi:hypothetical protein